MKKVISLFALLLAVTSIWAQPTITSFSPKSGPIGTTVTIVGTNFNSTVSNNIVYFGTIKATVTAVSTTSLTVVVPAGTTYNPITVTDTTTKQTAYSLQPFTTTFSCGGTIDSSSFVISNLISTEKGPYDIAIGDINGDGLNDVVSTSTNKSLVSVKLNPKVTFQTSSTPAFNFATGSGASFVRLADIDGDGKLDIVVTNMNANTISILKNTSTTSTVSFNAKIDFPLLNAYAISDIDGDGKPDILTLNTNGVSVSKNTSTPSNISFANPINYITGSGSHGLTVGDLNGDNKPDIAVVNYTDNNLSILTNTSSVGTISFATKIDFTTGKEPAKVAMCDLDGDGKLDVIVTSSDYTTNHVSYYQNISNGVSIQLGSRIDLNVGTGPNQIAVSDLDGDGKPDIAVLKNYDFNISLIKNTSILGAISFAPDVSIKVTKHPEGFAIGDLNSDGKPDLAVIYNDNIYYGIWILGNQIQYAPQISPSTSSICSGKTKTLSVNNASSYKWNTGLSNTAISVSPAIKTTYTVTGTSKDGCVGTASASVTVNTIPTISINTSTPTICSGTLATLTASGGSSYLWDNGTQNAKLSINPFITTTYTVTGTNTGGCSSVSSIIETVNPLPTVTITTDSSSIKVGSSTSIKANGANTFSWDNGQTTATQVVTPTITTTYLVTGTDGNGCSNTASQIIVVKSSTGVKEYSTKNITLYPNPTSSSFSVNTDKDALIQIYTLDGVLTFTKKIIGKELISVRDIPVGIYLVKLITDNIVTTTTLIVE